MLPYQTGLSEKFLYKLKKSYHEDNQFEITYTTPSDYFTKCIASSDLVALLGRIEWVEI